LEDWEMEIFDIVHLYNSEKMTLKQIGERYGVSKSTIQRRLTDAGCKYNKEEGKYIYIVDSDNHIQKEVEEIQKDTVFINRTYNIPEEIDKALKLKAILEGKTVVEILREILKNGIEPKYFDMVGGKIE
jgi:DNA-binding transcriptional regulator LsrR (DeoR family)